MTVLSSKRMEVLSEGSAEPETRIQEIRYVLRELREDSLRILLPCKQPAT